MKASLAVLCMRLSDPKSDCCLQNFHFQQECESSHAGLFIMLTQSPYTRNNSIPPSLRFVYNFSITYVGYRANCYLLNIALFHLVGMRRDFGHSPLIFILTCFCVRVNLLEKGIVKDSKIRKQFYGDRLSS